jgi:DNA-binding transcriptional regulator YdaS (Cro superfamily)
MELNTMTAHEKLKAWLREGGRKQTWLAEQVGVSPNTVVTWVKATKLPDADNRFAIERVTSGAVQAADWGAGE